MSAETWETWGGGCECWVTPEHMWTTHYGAVEPGSQVEFNPDCPKHGSTYSPAYQCGYVGCNDVAVQGGLCVEHDKKEGR